MAYKGKFLPVNKDKYKGDWRKITYRSSWEHFFMKWLDNNSDVVSWSSETVIIPYFSNADGKKRRYFMDFWAKFKSGQEFLFEVKPFKETQPPRPPANVTVKAKKRFMEEMYTYQVNSDKWKAAKKLADKMNLQFKIVTESSLKTMGWKG
ncbi:head completion protein [Proteus phage vB_PmiM_Pm5461]|uniref:Head completion nuclease n=1 Tax=Proteus phage vB_PmiM_Pm5461 TaxID=1636250 RepID=A0A0G2SSP9_9CAUD|nr:head closure [Proteus phage vB_PmiM_Pm5461]AKA61997.1 head completion protein [Proteus phage vB_PmiM_Pm5461]